MELRVHPRAWFDRRRARREADSWIGHGFEARYPWRVAELTSERERRSCARAIHGVLDELEGAKLPGPAPLRRASLQPEAGLLHEIEARLMDGAPVSAHGMLAVNDLLTSPGSPLFAESDDVHGCLAAVREKLEMQ
jgi:hypothetical protein